MTTLDTPIQFLKGVGPKLAELFSHLGVNSIHDFLFFFPRAYQDRRHIPKLGDLRYNEVCLVRVKVQEVIREDSFKWKKIFKVLVTDGSSWVTAVWFGQQYLSKVIKPGIELILSGRLELNTYNSEPQLLVQEFEILHKDDDLSLTLGIIVPVYHLTEGLYQQKVRSIAKTIIRDYLQLIEDPLPQDFRHQYRLFDLQPSVMAMHFPTNGDDYKRGRYRLVWDEFFYLQLSLLARRESYQQNDKTVVFKPAHELLKQYYAILPFTLTGAQQRVISEIQADMCSRLPMSRLVQGDVGCGKTEVSLAAMLIAVDSGYQSVMMAPTEILAEQHFRKISAILEKLNITCTLLIGKLKKKDKLDRYTEIANGKYQIVIGTHALIQEDLQFSNLGLAVVDEQHRFGVEQRSALRAKGYQPDILLMTATPIPRSLSLTLYGDLDKSTIDEMPPGRNPVETYFERERRKREAYAFVRYRLEKGEQAYIVFPLIEKSAKLDLKAASEYYVQIQEQLLPEFKIGLLHGRMKSDEKEAVMSRFRAGEIQVLVSTTVIEVGVDVANATVIIIENAERFGLAQLHQLRGRVGRGQKKGYCILIGDPKTEDSRKRLQALCDSTDGFYIAQVDLEVRGPGDFFGTRQSGLPFFRVANLVKDEKILTSAREAAKEVIAKRTLPEYENIFHQLETYVNEHPLD